MTDLLHRATELTTQGASDSTGPVARAAAAAEIDQLIEALKAEGNASYGGRYIFAGTATKTQPYLTGATDTYQVAAADRVAIDRKSTRLNSSHANISYAVFCLKKKTITIRH